MTRTNYSYYFLHFLNLVCKYTSFLCGLERIYCGNSIIRIDFEVKSPSELLTPNFAIYIPALSCPPYSSFPSHVIGPINYNHYHNNFAENCFLTKVPVIE